LVLVVAVLVGINVYVFVFRRGTSMRDLMKTAELNKQVAQPSALVAAASPPRLKADDPANEEARVVDGTMQESDTVERVWKSQGLPPKLVNDLANALGRVF